MTPPKNAAVARAAHGSCGPTPIVAVVVSAETRKGNNEKPGKAVWFAGSLYATNIQYLKQCASLVKMKKLFLFYSFLYVVNKLIDLRSFNKITSLKNYD